jgi:predicted metal-dependent phosphoesterase TrpH
MEKIDMHIFTTLSHPTEGAATPKQAVKIALKRGMNGLGIADHDCMGGAKLAREFAPRGFILLDGIEISTHEGHLVAFGIDEWDKKLVHLEEALDLIKDSAGIALLPHPNIEVMATSIIEPNISSFKDYFEGMYLLSTRHMLFYRHIKEIHKRYKFPALGCSYAHQPFEIGTAYTEFEGVANEDDVIEAIRKNRIIGPKIHKTPGGIFDIIRSNGSVVKKFTVHKFGWEVNHRILLCGEAITDEIHNMGEFTRESLLEEIFTSGRLEPIYRQDVLFILILDEMLAASLKEGALARKGEKFVLAEGRQVRVSESSRRKIYLKYFFELARNFASRS